MDGKNAQATTLAFKRARSRSLKIKELGITPEITEDETNALIETLAKAKAVKEGSEDDTEYIRGQRIYVEGLIALAKLPTAQERIDYEYHNAFADVAKEEEMVQDLDAIIAA